MADELKPVPVLAANESFPWHGNDDDRAELSEILKSKLYLSGWRGADKKDEMKALGITHVVSLLASDDSENPFPEDFKYHNVVITDDEDQDMLVHLDKCTAFISVGIANGRVLVHCAAGISRSSTAVIAYLIKYEKMSLHDAFLHTINHRRVIWPNDGFMMQLLQYEKKYRKGENTLDLKQYVQWGGRNAEKWMAKVLDRDGKKM